VENKNKINLNEKCVEVVQGTLDRFNLKIRPKNYFKNWRVSTSRTGDHSKPSSLL
jgi:hypothetical protein